MLSMKGIWFVRLKWGCPNNLAWFVLDFVAFGSGRLFRSVHDRTRFFAKLRHTDADREMLREEKKLNGFQPELTGLALKLNFRRKRIEYWPQICSQTAHNSTYLRCWSIWITHRWKPQNCFKFDTIRCLSERFHYSFQHCTIFLRMVSVFVCLFHLKMVISFISMGLIVRGFVPSVKPKIALHVK